jgi:hypothetical protein
MAPIRILLGFVIAIVLLAGWSPRATAHEVPNEVTLIAFVKPQGKTLTLLIRAPMESLRDVDVPLKPNGFLDLSRIDTPMRDAAQLWIRDFIQVSENGHALGRPTLVAARVALPSDRSFTSYNSALAGIRGAPLPADTEMYWKQGMLDVAYEYPITSDRSDFAVRPGMTQLGVQVNVGMRFEPPNGPERAFDVHADVGTVHLDPSWRQAFFMFAKEGFFHILGGIDHLLFLFALVIPFRRFRPLVTVVTAFTVAHSITLAASAFGLAPGALWFPALIEMLVAISILYMALENIVGAKLNRRWAVAFGFGLVHGFAFSFLLRERLQFAGSHLISSLLAFNIGVELGQLLVLAITVPVLGLLFKYIVREKVGTIILSALVAHTAWHWMTERGTELGKYPWPTLNAETLSTALWWAMAAVALAATLWLLSGLARRRQAPGGEREDATIR